MSVLKTWQNGKWTITQIPAKLEFGIYELPTGEIYVVKPNMERTRMYAKRLVMISGERLTEGGEHKRIEFQYEAGAIFRILPEHRMDLERAKSITIKYGHCLVCGRRLKDAGSVEHGIGPVCIKYFRVKTSTGVQ